MSNTLSSYYLIAFGYFAQLEVLHHLLYIVCSTLKEGTQPSFYDLRPGLHYCPMEANKKRNTEKRKPDNKRIHLHDDMHHARKRKV